MCSDACGVLRYGGPPPPRHPRETPTRQSPEPAVVLAALASALRSLPGGPTSPGKRHYTAAAMSVKTEAIGKEWPATTYEVGKEKIREYATVVGLENPV